MDQQELRLFEGQCIQEEQPFCTAACPIHIDVRTFIGCIAAGDMRGARRVLDRTMPFVEIVGRICDHPCQPACKRREIDTSLAIGGLEKFCVSTTQAVLKPPHLPAKGGRVAVIGSGLSAMTLALDLARKGRSTEILTEQTKLGGTLHTYNEKILPADAFVSAEDSLKYYGVTISCNCNVTPDFFHEARKKYDAVYIDRDGMDFLWASADFIDPDPVTLAVNYEGCFAGGGIIDGVYSVIKQVEDGRRAALTIERYLQRVSLIAQREKEGPCTTRMYTVIAGIQSQQQVIAADPVGGFTREEAVAEAGRCLQCECMECVKQCIFLQEFKDYPKRLVRKIYNNEAIVQGIRAANKMINSCSLCGQCTVICPNDFPMPDICFAARRNMTAKGKMPPSAHDFPLLDMEFSLSDFFAVSRHQPGCHSSNFLFYPGCQLSGSSPTAVEQTYLYLTRHMSGGVGLTLGCCGIPAHWAGRERLFDETIQKFQEDVTRMGNPVIITACSSCFGMFKKFTPELAVKSLWQVFEEIGLPQEIGVIPLEPLTIHDPCTTRHEPGIRQSIRNLVKQMGFTIEENPFSGEMTDCCGYGGLMQFANPALGGKAAQNKGRRSSRPGLAYCAMCRDNISETGKPVAHLLDYIFPVSVTGDPLLRSNPGFSMRYENRARLKQHLLSTLWHEEQAMNPAYKNIRLLIEPQVRTLLEARHILEDDIRKVIHHAEQAKRKLVNPKNGRFLASFKPVRVTYWVEYESTGEGFVIHNAYSHRMILPGEKT